MARKDSSDCVVTVTIELGHQANFLKEPSPEGFTHDWTVFVRGYEGSRIEYFVEKVVFKLHKTFKSPVRVVSEPPFKVTESGYAGFILPIEIHFRNKQTPRKIAFFYDLFLNAKDSPPINNVRYEKLKFQNPTPEFKAKLIKAGGTEQGAEPVPYAELFGSPVRSEKKLLPKIPKDKERDKDKIKKRKKSSPHTKSSSPAPSLSSLSSMSSDDDDESYTAPLPPPPPPPVKKEKEVSIKKESSSSSSLSQPKQEPLSSSSSSPSALKDKVKHRSSSSSSSHKDRTGLDKDASHRPHKHKDKDRDRSSSHKEREGGKKEKDSSSQKVSKEREGSHTSSKSSTLSSQHENKTPTVHKDKERSSQSKEKDMPGSSSKTKSSKERDKSSSKEKHFSSKAISPSLVPESTKVKEESSKDKSKDKDRHKKSHKRPIEPGSREGESEKKKQKSSSSVTGSDDRPVKPKSSSGKESSSKEKELPKESSKEVKDRDSKSSSSKEVKDRDSKSSSVLGKSKHEKSRHSEQHRHSHSSDSKQKESPVKKAETPLKSEKAGKSEALTQSERLAMTADFQPQLLLSPLKNKSDEEGSLAPSPVTETKKLKRSTSNSSLGSQSSVSSCDGAAPKSDHEMQEPPADRDSHIVSGLTDSDSDSEEETPYVKSPQKELKSNLSKQATQTTLHVSSNKSSANKVARGISVDEKQKKTDQELVNNVTKGSDQTSKHSKEDKRAVNVEDSKSTKAKYSEATVDSSDDDANVQKINVTNGTSDHNCNGLDILAPNGISIGELIAINEKIEKAQADSNQELLEKVIRVIGETDDFDLNDVFLCFDICSVDKSVVQQIQAVLREF